ncbi:MAG: NAD(P)-binding protein, partial [Bacteroidetes bacterium]|nr:NAD(P)-binding protein [Candidatus Egerieousia excrementavium]
MRQSVVIIGSGLGGLSAGVILAKNGCNVTVLEQNSRIGGCLQCFSRNGVKFETGMHFIGSADKGQILYKLLHYLGIYDSLTLSRLDENCYNTVSIMGERFRFANGRENFMEQMATRFPSQRRNLERYLDIVESIAEASSLHSLK